ncbi:MULTISPECIES: cbb3-type cytochrome oxidase assembly protein CcoS [unclassified Lysobacter]
MNILLFLIPVSMLALGVALWAFIWAVKRGQFEDLDTPALDILREDEHDRVAPLPPPATGTADDIDIDAVAPADGRRTGDGRQAD